MLRDVQQPKMVWLQSLNAKAKLGMVRVQRRKLKGKGEEHSRMRGAKGYGGIRARADTIQQGRGMRKSTSEGRPRKRAKKWLKKVQSRRMAVKKQ